MSLMLVMAVMVAFFVVGSALLVGQWWPLVVEPLVFLPGAVLFRVLHGGEL